jgi:hypothetical protein
MNTFPSSPPPPIPPDPTVPANRVVVAEREDVQTLPRPTTTIPSTQFTFDLSSDPIAITPIPRASHGLTAGPHRLNRLPRKRTPNSPPPGPPRNDKSPRNQDPGTQDSGYTAKSAILEARDLIVLASTLTTSRNEQTRLLDLLEVFREYTEKGQLYKASTIITSQIANLETATR